MPTSLDPAKYGGLSRGKSNNPASKNEYFEKKLCHIFNQNIAA